MEGVAARAGVSKALGYRYFDNADDLLVAVHDREMVELGSRVRAALRSSHTFEEGIRASLTAWLDRLAERGTVVTSLMQAGPVSGRVQERSRRMHATVSEFYGQRAADTYDLDLRTATAAASILLTGLDGLIDCWVNRRMPRREIVDVYTTMCLGAFEALAARPPLIGQRSMTIRSIDPVD